MNHRFANEMCPKCFIIKPIADYTTYTKSGVAETHKLCNACRPAKAPRRTEADKACASFCSDVKHNNKVKQARIDAAMHEQIQREEFATQDAKLKALGIAPTPHKETQEELNAAYQAQQIRLMQGGDKTNE